jgi:pimeloyl-ACP methyl ester carboxylesterase
MHDIISADGTTIVYERSGCGPSLVLVHGTTIDHTQWSHVAAELGRHFTVYAVDRRGRGESGDAKTYTLEHEVDDLRTLIDAVPAPVDVLGHSYGALCSLEAARLTPNIARLALYEPPLGSDVSPVNPAGLLDRFTSLVDAGDAENALLMAFAASETPDETVRILRSRPSWQSRIAAARTVPREVEAVHRYRFDPLRFSDVQIPILLLVGGESPPVYRSAVETLHRSLPHTQLAVLAGQQHEAIDTAPELFLREIIRFFVSDRHRTGHADSRQRLTAGGAQSWA